MKKTSQKLNSISVVAVIFLLTTISIAAPPIRNTELSNAVANAETLTANGDYGDAADAYLQVINLNNANAQAELNENKEFCLYPYSLCLHLERLECLRKAKQRRMESFGNECRQILVKFKEQAAGNKWNGYMAVYDHLMKHYRVNKNKEMVIKTFEEAVAYNPLHNNTCFYIDYLLQTAPEPIDQKIVLKIRYLIELYKNTAGKLSSGMALRKLFFTKAINGDVFSEAIDYLKTYPNTMFHEIKWAIVMARDSISYDKPEQVKEYYNTLNILAIKQTNTESRLEVVGYIINEKKKIEAIMPEIKTQ